MLEQLMSRQVRENRRKQSWDQPQLKHSIAASSNARKQVNEARQIVNVNIVTERDQAYYKKKIKQIEQRLAEYEKTRQQLMQKSIQTRAQKKQYLTRMETAEDELEQVLDEKKILRSRIERVELNSLQHEQLLEELEQLALLIKMKEMKYEDFRKQADIVIKCHNIFQEKLRNTIEYMQQETRKLHQYNCRIVYEQNRAIESNDPRA